VTATLCPTAPLHSPAWFRPFSQSDAGAKAYKGHDIFANEPSVVQDLQGRMSDRKAAHLEGHDIFSNEPSAPEGYMSEIKAAHLEGHDVFSETRNAFVPSKQQSETMMQSLEGHDVFSETRNAFVPAKHQSDTKMQSDVRGHDVFGETAEPHRPGTAKSRAKAAEMSGQDIFSNGKGHEHVSCPAICNVHHTLAPVKFFGALLQRGCRNGQ